MFKYIIKIETMIAVILCSTSLICIGLYFIADAIDGLNDTIKEYLKQKQ
jgi:hypothetical protein